MRVFKIRWIDDQSTIPIAKTPGADSLFFYLSPRKAPASRVLGKHTPVNMLPEAMLGIITAQDAPEAQRVMASARGRRPRARSKLLYGNIPHRGCSPRKFTRAPRWVIPLAERMAAASVCARVRWGGARAIDGSRGRRCWK